MLNPDEHFIEDVRSELSRAREKFPSANLAFVALVEEVGELAQALLKLRAAIGRGEEYPQHHEMVYREAVQVAVMAMRVATEIDDSFNVNYVEPASPPHPDLPA